MTASLRWADVERLQQGLEQLYRLDPAPNVRQFIIEARGSRREQLIIIEEQDLFVGVSLQTQFVDALGDERLQTANLDSFCVVVEAVSHFLLVVNRARKDQPATELELELQAEVDKYVAALMLANRCPSLSTEALRQQLYDNFRLCDDLSDEEQQRYRVANTLARRYARGLERRFVRRGRLPAMLGELRRFYRMTYGDKQRLIDRPF